ncbi:GlxA family transcriptional regulator [Allohahella marinimesophila]|uniref:GlxA family transcriptional regulator n=1 Tax=Allohahella marinimesophila TaxID=1054972 RepID=A0ABP7NPI1_9GAMM
MIKVVVAGFDGCLASALTGAADVFRLAGVTWERLHGEISKHLFEVQIASVGGEDIHCTSGIVIKPHMALEHIEACDLVLVPTIGGRLDRVLASSGEVAAHLRRLAAGGSDLASNDTGAFLLAESGLLDGRKATTHWGFTAEFRARYPQVRLQTEKLITTDGQVFCAGGGSAWLDLVFFLIERYHGYEIARTTARVFVFDYGRNNQSAYSSLQARFNHRDEPVSVAQAYIQSHYAEPILVTSLAALVNLSERTFKRRFKQATGLPPRSYLQKVRIDSARRLLERSRENVDQIALSVGYSESASFNRLFKREVGMSPGHYRSKFSRTV